MRDIARQTGTVPGTLHKELSRLAEVGILRKELQGNQVRYQANMDCVIYEELAAFISLEALFGSTSTWYDSHKGSFEFPLLLTATRREKLLRYSVVVNDLRGGLRVRFSRLGEEPTPKFAPLIPPVDHELSRRDLDYLTEFIIGFLLNYSQVAVKAAGSFHRVVPSELLIYGSLDGDLFEKILDDERAFDRVTRETEAKLGDLETGRRCARVEALLDAVERGGLWHP